jgi:hypothetical protein
MKLKPSSLGSLPLYDWTSNFLTAIINLNILTFLGIPNLRTTLIETHTCLQILRYFIETIRSFLINLRLFCVCNTKDINFNGNIRQKTYQKNRALFQLSEDQQAYQLPWLLFTGKIGENCDHLVSRCKKLA